MKQKGIALSMMTAVISGVSIFANALFVSRADPLVFALIRNCLVALFLSALLIATGMFGEIRLLGRKDWVKLALIGVVGGGLPFALFFSGLAQIGAVNGNIIQKTLFIWVALLAVPVLREKVTKMQIAGYAIIFTGMFLVNGTGAIVWKQGAWLVLAATLFWAAEQIIAKLTLKRIHPLIVSWGRMLFGLPVLLIAAALMGKSALLVAPHSYAIVPLGVSAGLLSAYMISWYWALSMAPATIVSSVLVVAPVVTALLAGGLLHKPFVSGQWLSFSVILAGAILMVIERLLPKRPSEAL